MAKVTAIPIRATKQNKIGGWAFLVGIILAIILGMIGQLSEGWLFVLVIIGLIVGFLNITEEEAGKFLMSGTVLIIASAFGQNVMDTSRIFSGILQTMLAIFVPATIIVAIKNVFGLAKH